ncbi:BnaC03g44890D [Brassica napus]|uniref:BnaC03g44890D protein n=1 Tax=Brassica napus TaxID=3708 RepID=A0A078IJH3_BRANA|nr:BnaC03g44890D [Brassica napus]
MKKVMTIAVMRKVVLSDVEKLMIGSVDNTTMQTWRKSGDKNLIL